MKLLILFVIFLVASGSAYRMTEVNFDSEDPSVNEISDEDFYPPTTTETASTTPLRPTFDDQSIPYRPTVHPRRQVRPYRRFSLDNFGYPTPVPKGECQIKNLSSSDDPMSAFQLKAWRQMANPLMYRLPNDTVSIDDFTGKPTGGIEYPYNLEFRNLTIKGLSTVKDLTSISLSQSSFESSAQVGELFYSGWYSMNTTRKGLPVLGKGPFHITLTNMRANFKIIFDTELDTGFVSVKDLTMNFESFPQINAVMENMVIDGRPVDWNVVNMMYKNIGQMMQSPIMKGMLEAVYTANINRILEGCTWKDIMDSYLTPSTVNSAIENRMNDSPSMPMI